MLTPNYNELGYYASLDQVITHSQKYWAQGFWNKLDDPESTFGALWQAHYKKNGPGNVSDFIANAIAKESKQESDAENNTEDNGDGKCNADDDASAANTEAGARANTPARNYTKYTLAGERKAERLWEADEEYRQILHCGWPLFYRHVFPRLCALDCVHVLHQMKGVEGRLGFRGYVSFLWKWQRPSISVYKARLTSQYRNLMPNANNSATAWLNRKDWPYY